MSQSSLYRPASFRVQPLSSNTGDPSLDRLGDELRAIVRTNVTGHAAQAEQVGQHVDHIRRLELTGGHPDGQALTRELVDDVEHPELASVMRARLDEVIRPDVVAVLRP